MMKRRGPPVQKSMMDFFSKKSKNRNRAEIVLARDEHLCRDPDSVLCGPLKLVRRQQAEVAVGQFRIRRASLDMVDFTPGLQDYSYSFVVANPNRQTSAAAVNWRAYSRPFSPAVWLCAAAMAALVWLIWCLVQRAADRRPPHLRDTAWSVLCILMQQGAELSPRSVSARQVVGCFWIFCVILLASYTSNIISLLVSVGRALPFSTLQELAGRRGWRVAVQPGGRADALLQGRTELQNHEIVYQSSLKDSLERILRDDKFTVFAGHTEADHLVRSSCSLVWTPLRLDVVHTHWALQKHLPYGARIANLLNRLVEAGVISRSQRPWAVSRGSCRNPTASFQTISLRHTLTAFALLAVGAVAGALLLCAELVYRRRVCRPLPRTPPHQPATPVNATPQSANGATPQSANGATPQSANGATPQSANGATPVPRATQATVNRRAKEPCPAWQEPQ